MGARHEISEPERDLFGHRDERPGRLPELAHEHQGYDLCLEVPTEINFEAPAGDDFERHGVGLAVSAPRVPSVMEFTILRPLNARTWKPTAAPIQSDWYGRSVILSLFLFEHPIHKLFNG